MPATLLDRSRQRGGRVTRAWLLEAGVPRGTIDDWLASHRLGKDHDGVYHFPGAPGTWDGHAHAAVLALEKAPVDEAAVAVAGAGAGHLHGLLGCVTPPRPIPVLTTRRSRAVLDGVRLAYDPTLTARQIVAIRGLPVTGVARTLVDLAAVPPRPIGDVLTNAYTRGLVTDLDPVADALAAVRRPAGRSRDRRIIARLDELAIALERLEALAGRPRSGREVTAAELVVAHDYPPPLLNAPVTCCGRTSLLDLFWGPESINAEVDGPHHRWPTQRRRDRERDFHLREHRGIEVIRITVDEIDERPETIIDRLAAVWPTA